MNELLTISLDRQLTGLIGLALRSSTAACGFEASKRAITKGKGAFILVDQALGINSLKKILALANRQEKPVFAVEKNENSDDLLSVSGYKIVTIFQGGVAKGFIDKLKQERKWL